MLGIILFVGFISIIALLYIGHERDLSNRYPSESSNEDNEEGE